MTSGFQKASASESLGRIAEATTVGLFAISVLVSAPLCLASQSSITQKTSFNSDRQLTSLINGSWGFDDRAFVSASYAHSRTPITGFDETDTFHQGNITMGYGLKNVAFDIGFNISNSPLSEITTLGGTFGITYIYIPSDANPEDYQGRALTNVHRQVYIKEEEQPPLLWMRFGYTGNSMHSELLGFPKNVGKETTFTFDLYVPYSEDLLFNSGVSFHGYDNSRGFFSQSLENMTSIERQLLASTIQGLPHTTAYLGAIWQIAPRDALNPRYQATEIDSSRQWAHTLDLGWRHQFSKNWFLNPIYEVSTFSGRAASGVILELLYIF